MAEALAIFGFLLAVSGSGLGLALHWLVVEAGYHEIQLMARLLAVLSAMFGTMFFLPQFATMLVLVFENNGSVLDAVIYAGIELVAWYWFAGATGVGYRVAHRFHKEEKK